MQLELYEQINAMSCAIGGTPTTPDMLTRYRVKDQKNNFSYSWIIDAASAIPEQHCRIYFYVWNQQDGNFVSLHVCHLNAAGQIVARSETRAFQANLHLVAAACSTLIQNIQSHCTNHTHASLIFRRACIKEQS